MKVMIEVGTLVPCVEKNGKIASWKRPDGSFFCKVALEEYTIMEKPYDIFSHWRAVQNPDYRGQGLVVFLDRKPELGEVIKITATGKTYAIGKVITD